VNDDDKARVTEVQSQLQVVINALAPIRHRLPQDCLRSWENTLVGCENALITLRLHLREKVGLPT
jgi:hypothetical protein